MTEYKLIQKSPLDGIEVKPNESNIHEWHFLIRGAEKTPYHGGEYHGKLMFPSEYPHAPPSIYMFTPSGRFETGVRICTSMSDFHPESWVPSWSVSTIIMGIASFMVETASEDSW